MQITNIKKLKHRWENLLTSFQVEPTKSQIVFCELVAAYSNICRFYHTLQHIQQVLETIAEIQKQTSQLTGQTIDFSAIQLAAWFHDVIYEPQCKDNEEKSAVYAKTILTQFDLPIKTIKLVESLILNTKYHQSLSMDLNNQIFLDADLAILGASKFEYQAYCQQIRQEYSWLNDQLYCCGRQQILQQFLQRKRIYCTQQMFIKLESRARLNLQAEMLDLSRYSGIMMT
jgi:predicted metal-dependent HD superfamily phosphohydrolase